MDGHGQLRAVPAPSGEEAAAIAAAIARFRADLSPPAGAPAATADGWRRAALLEGVERQPELAADPWLGE